MNRRSFLQQSLAASAVFGTSVFAQAQTTSTPPPAKKTAERDRGPQIDAAKVREFVGAGHANLARVKELLAEQPALINASWDWGSGDFETALGAASHVGSRPIALHLLDAGARLDALCAAMLGEVAVVSALLRLTPTCANARGPHGYSMLYHAAYTGNVAIAEAISPHLSARARDCNQALQVASMTGQKDFVAWLLAHGVDNPNTKTFQGKTSLDLALARKHDAVAQLLRDAGGLSTE